jgi:hypothetical protein
MYIKIRSVPVALLLLIGGLCFQIAHAQELGANRQRFHDNTFKAMNRQRNCYTCNKRYLPASTVILKGVDTSTS